MSLRLSGIEIDTIFALNGDDENSATFAFGWALSSSPTLLRAITHDLVQDEVDPERASIKLQKFGKDKGYTDIEIFIPNICHIIIEAKRNWELPLATQLEKYADRLKSGHVPSLLLVSLSAASREHAKRHLPPTVSKIPLVHRSWADLHELVHQAFRGTKSNTEKLWLREFEIHLRGYVSMRNPQDNRVYVVALSSASIEKGKDYTWIDVVEKDNCYFHPMRKGWPVVPPNYIAFRYHGQLQSVHYIESYKIESDLSSINENWPNKDNDHFIYKLGPAMKPLEIVKSGPVWNRRAWCFIDTLLSGTCKTIEEAIDETGRRSGEFKLD